MSDREELLALRRMAELEAKASGQPAPPSVFPKTEEKPNLLMSAVTGVNSLLPQLAGLPMDTMRNLANIGISGYGMGRQLAGQAMGESASEAASNAPNPIGEPIGGSQWIANKLNQAAGEDMFSNPRPDSALGQMLHTGTNIAGSGFISPASSIRGSAGNVAKMIPSAIGGSVGQQVSDDPLAPVIGSMLPGAAKIPINALPRAKVNPNLSKATSGYVVPPSEAKPSFVNNTLESISGKAATSQKASIKNQEVTNNLVSKELSDSAKKIGVDFPDGPISRERLSSLRNEAGKVYDETSKLGIFTTDETFRRELGQLTGETSALRKELPELLNKDIAPLVKIFKGKENLSAKATVEAIKEMRQRSSDNYASGNKAMARAEKGIADSLEGLIERNIVPKQGKEFVDRFKNARQLIAKTYSTEKALNDSTGNISASKLGNELNKGKPISGGLKQVAEFANAFPKSVQMPEKTGGQVSKLQAALSPLLGLTGGIAAGPAGMALAALPFTAPPAARSLILSNGYQNRLSKVKKPSNVDAKARALAAILSERND